MPILYAVVARGTTVLAKYASCAGNFTEVTEQILSKIGPEDSKLTYSHGSYLFHYINEERIIYLCITDDDFERSKAFLFLNDIKRRFQTQYGVRAQTALPYSMNSEFSRVIASQMRYVTDKREPDQMGKVQNQVDELKGIMVRNIDNIADRGEKLELLVDKTEELNANAVSFKKTSRGLARSLWMKNIKITVILVIVVIILQDNKTIMDCLAGRHHKLSGLSRWAHRRPQVVLYFIISAACGGLDWPCTK